VAFPTSGMDDDDDDDDDTNGATQFQHQHTGSDNVT
jgi:hypothetical protein